jgi:hypothetical protein
MSIKYQVIKKVNGKFAPRIVSQFGSCWFEPPYEYDSREEAVKVVMLKRQADQIKIASEKEEVVFSI